MDNVVLLRHDMYRRSPPLPVVGGTMPGVSDDHLQFLRLAGREPSTVYARDLSLIHI